MAFPAIGAIFAKLGGTITSGVVSALSGSRIALWAAGAFAFLGLQFAVQEFAVGPLLDEVSQYAQGATGALLDWLGFLQFDRVITMILSAISLRYAISSGKVFLKRS